jgi:hypothetical protein
MRNVTGIALAAIASIGLLVAGCEDRRDNNNRGFGGAGTEQRQTNQDGRIGDGKVGGNNGVLDDGEGPLERRGKADDKIGNNPGVINDGEGPIERQQQGNTAPQQR